MSDPIIRRGDDVLCGRLIALDTSSASVLGASAAWQNRGDSFNNSVSIDFPAMPDVIELMREADFAVSTNPTLPDGIHVYKGTKPLEIPISFKLHSFDKQYCRMGALTLLQLAARLHAFVLPISTYPSGTEMQATAASTQGSGKDSAHQEASSASINVVPVSGAGVLNGGVFSPVTCYLHLMWTGANSPGIAAVGYVRGVGVKFSGPWLRGPNGSFNLPTSAEFSFTFVHRPGYGNGQSYIGDGIVDGQIQGGEAYANDVKSLLYNTRSLIDASATGYQGFAPRR